MFSTENHGLFHTGLRRTFSLKNSWKKTITQPLLNLPKPLENLLQTNHVIICTGKNSTGSTLVKVTDDLLMASVESSLYRSSWSAGLHKYYWSDFHETKWKGGTWAKKEPITFCNGSRPWGGSMINDLMTFFTIEFFRHFHQISRGIVQRSWSEKKSQAYLGDRWWVCSICCSLIGFKEAVRPRQMYALDWVPF